MVRVAMLSKWHVHAKGYAELLKKSGKAEITAVWDDDAARGKSWADELGCPFEADLDALLGRNDVDAVVCCAPTTAHRDVLVKAASAGKHLFTEKALAPTVRECEEIKKAVEKAGVTFVISYPQRGRPCVQLAKRLIAEGKLGKVSMVRVRDAHNGVSGNRLPAYWFEKKDAAGGAMMDLGCHPMYLLAYFLGKPKRVTGLFTAPYGKPVDENAVAIAEFEGGALGVAETGFLTANSPQSLEIYGEAGSLIAHGESVFLNGISDTAANPAVTLNGLSMATALPQPKPLPLFQFIDAVVSGAGSPEGLGIDDAIDLTRLLESAYLGDRENRIVSLP